MSQPRVIIKRSLSDRLTRIVLLIVLVGACYAGYKLLEARLQAQLYKGRLSDVASRYRELQGHYNTAVRRSAVTELLVMNGKLSVVIRTLAGELRRLETPADPATEVYVDYIVHDSRLWIRRVFDANTPPGKGTLIDPELGQIAWTERDGHVGKAVYRQLSEGRWLVSVTGNGALGLRKVNARELAELLPAPDIKTYDPQQDSVLDATAKPSFKDLINAFK